MVLDEPTAALDPTSSELIFRPFQSNKTKGITVVVGEQKSGLLLSIAQDCRYGQGLRFAVAVRVLLR